MYFDLTAKSYESKVLSSWAKSRPNAAARMGIKNGLGDRSNGQLTINELSNLISGGVSASSGSVVNEATAMRVSAVYACVALIAGAISTLPMNVYKRTNDGREQTDHPYWWLLNEQPDTNCSAAVFWEYLVSSRMFYGDGFAEIVRTVDYRGYSIKGFKAHHPLRVNPYHDDQGNLLYRITPLTGSQYVVDPFDIIHISSLGYDGLTSPSPITYAARQAVGTAIATADYNGRFFQNGARPDFALMTDGNMTKEQAELLRTTWHDKHGGAMNAHLPAILTGGLKVQQLTMSAQDSQIMATASWNLEEICRVLGVPPFMVGSTEKTTSWGTGQENMGRGFVKYTLLRDLRKIEQEFNRKLWPSREKYFVEFDVSGIERGDLKTENEALRIAVGRAGEPGWMTVNEVRRRKLLAPMDGGDELNPGIRVTESLQADQNAKDQQAADQKKADTKAYVRETVQAFAAAQKEPTINVHVDAPVVNVTTPETVVHNTFNLPETTNNFEAVMPAQDAPVVNIAAQEAPIVNVVNNLPDQPAPIVNVTNDVQLPTELKITGLPDRETTSTVVRDAMGNIVKTTQTETDA